MNILVALPKDWIYTFTIHTLNGLITNVESYTPYYNGLCSYIQNTINFSNGFITKEEYNSNYSNNFGMVCDSDNVVKLISSFQDLVRNTGMMQTLPKRKITKVIINLGHDGVLYGVIIHYH